MLKRLICSSLALAFAFGFFATTVSADGGSTQLVSISSTDSGEILNFNSDSFIQFTLHNKEQSKIKFHLINIDTYEKIPLVSVDTGSVSLRKSRYYHLKRGKYLVETKYKREWNIIKRIKKRIERNRDILKETIWLRDMVNDLFN